MGSNMKTAHALTGIRLTPSSPFYLNNIFLTNKFQLKQDDNWTFIFKYPSSLRFRNIILGFLFFFFQGKKKNTFLKKNVNREVVPPHSGCELGRWLVDYSYQFGFDRFYVQIQISTFDFDDPCNDATTYLFMLL